MDPAAGVEVAPGLVKQKVLQPDARALNASALSINLAQPPEAKLKKPTAKGALTQASGNGVSNLNPCQGLCGKSCLQHRACLDWGQAVPSVESGLLKNTVNA